MADPTGPRREERVADLVEGGGRHEDDKFAIHRRADITPGGSNRNGKQ
jgi:hypothetical protein